MAILTKILKIHFSTEYWLLQTFPFIPGIKLKMSRKFCFVTNSKRKHPLHNENISQMRNKETVRTLAYLIRTFDVCLVCLLCMWTAVCLCGDARLYTNLCYVMHYMCTTSWYNIVLYSDTLCVEYIYFRFHVKIMNSAAQCRYSLLILSLSCLS